MKNKVNKIYNANNLDVLKELADNSADLLLTDIPYGLQDIDAIKLIKDNINGTKGFMLDFYNKRFYDYVIKH